MSSPSFDASPNIPSVIEPDPPGRAGAYSTLDQDRALFAPLNNVPPVYRDFVNAAIATGGALSQAAIPSLNVSGSFATGPSATIGMFGAAGTGKVTISGGLTDGTALKALLSALASWGFITDQSNNVGASGDVIVHNLDGSLSSSTLVVRGF